jgi:hypothetical protein
MSQGFGINAVILGFITQALNKFLGPIGQHYDHSPA